jgi:hypothetical protein
MLWELTGGNDRPSELRMQPATAVMNPSEISVVEGMS